jgi:hypothetical protein
MYWRELCNDKLINLKCSLESGLRIDQKKNLEDRCNPRIDVKLQGS